MVQEDEPGTQIFNKIILRKSLKLKFMNKIYNINFIFIFARRIWKDFFNVFFRSFKKDIFNIFLEKTLLNKQGCKGKTSFSFFSFFFFNRKMVFEKYLDFEKNISKKIHGFLFLKGKKFWGSKKNPMIFIQRRVSKDFTCSKDFFFSLKFFFPMW